MQFSTPIPVQKYSNAIDYNSKLVSIGSCFAENIGEKLHYFKFQNTVNPFGIIFNTVSLEKIIRRCVEKRYFTDEDIFVHDDLWHCYEVHSELSNPDKNDFLTRLNSLIDVTNQQLTEATHVLITLGTSWVYQLNSNNEIVANCHKVPQKEFTKQLLSIAEIEESLQNIVSNITSVNNEAKFIFTVSPVRHSKDGFIENNVSKAHLISAIYKVVSQQPTTVNYFPSYEIMMDELRDYRFYANDMLHPSQQAIDFIWIKFFENYVNEQEFQTMQEICTIQKGLSHRPFNPNTEAHKKFLNALNQKIEAIRKQFPHIAF
jgi:lysophospholipase L1-like esterase